MFDKRIIEIMRDVPEISAFIVSMTPEQSREFGKQFIKEQAQYQGISEVEAMNNLAAMWMEIREKAENVFPALVEHMNNILSVCD